MIRGVTNNDNNTTVNIRDHFRVCSRVLTSIFGHNVILGKEPSFEFCEEAVCSQRTRKRASRFEVRVLN